MAFGWLGDQIAAYGSLVECPNFLVYVQDWSVRSGRESEGVRLRLLLWLSALRLPVGREESSGGQPSLAWTRSRPDTTTQLGRWVR